MAIKAILWDCDGVLQHPAHDWDDALSRLGGAEFTAALFEAEHAALRGARSLRDVVADLVDLHPVAVSVEDVLALWSLFEADEPAWRVVDDARAAGVRCVLATNQQDIRVELMRHERKYDDRVDGAYYSSEIGHMKPSREFFEAILADLGIEAQEALFVDDVLSNIESARSLGIVAVHHDPASGAAELRREVAEHIPDLRQ